jgi:hypothetical protein
MALQQVAEDQERGLLEEVHGFCRQQQAEAAHGATLEDAGRSSAYARVMAFIRKLQKRESREG